MISTPEKFEKFRLFTITVSSFSLRTDLISLTLQFGSTCNLTSSLVFLFLIKIVVVGEWTPGIVAHDLRTSSRNACGVI